MKIIFILVIILSLFGLFLSFRNIRTFSGEIKLTDIINTILTAILVLVTMYYAWMTAESVRASKDMAFSMKQSNQINYRPYVQIEGIQPDYIADMASHDPLNLKTPIRTSGFMVLLYIAT